MFLNLFKSRHVQDEYGEIGFFSKRDPQTRNYTYANWGSRRWEYYYVERLLTELNIKEKNIVDIGIGLPTDSNFYEFYIKSGCNLIAFDPDDRLDDATQLSARCHILRRSAESTDLESGSIDAVVALSSLEHFPYDAFLKTIEEVYRILKDEGHFIITLDLTYDKRMPARWAILEKTMNGLPSKEDDESLADHHQQLTLEHFVKLISPYFYAKDGSVTNKDLKINQLVYSKKWNSHIAYLHLYKLAK